MSTNTKIRKVRLLLIAILLMLGFMKKIKNISLRMMLFMIIFVMALMSGA